MTNQTLLDLEVCMPDKIQPRLYSMMKLNSKIQPRLHNMVKFNQKILALYWIKLESCQFQNPSMITQHGDIQLEDYQNEKRSLFWHHTDLNWNLANFKIQP